MKHKIKNSLVIISVTSLLVLYQNCGKKPADSSTSAGNPTPVTSQGERKIGIHINQANGEAFTTTFNQVLVDKFNHINMHQIWGPGTFNPSILPVAPFVTNAAGTAFDFNVLSTANSFYPNYNRPVMLTIGTIDTNNKFVPSDYNAVAFDDAGMRAAFKNMINNMMPTIANTNLVSLQIGNEVDIYLGTNATAWAQYKTFFDDVAAHARAWRPGLKVGVTVTLAGAISATQKAFVKDLMTNADIVSVTYYPMNADFSVKSPSVAEADIAALVTEYGSKPIYFQEVGYSSGGSYIGSSEEMQRQFVANFFSAWDKYSSNIPIVSWLNYTEWSQAAVDGYGTQYGMCPSVYCNSFKEYLQTLGLRSYSSGATKPALTELRSQMTSRSWAAP